MYLLYHHKATMHINYVLYIQTIIHNYAAFPCKYISHVRMNYLDNTEISSIVGIGCACWCFHLLAAWRDWQELTNQIVCQFWLDQWKLHVWTLAIHMYVLNRWFHRAHSTGFRCRLAYCNCCKTTPRFSKFLEVCWIGKALPVV